MSDNERTLLGALLRFPDRVPLALGVVSPKELEDKTCVSAYVALAKLAKAGQPTTPAAVRALLLSAGKPYASAAAGRLDEWQVLAHDALAGDVEALAGAVRVEARRRSLRAVMDRLGALAGQSSCDPDEWLTAAQEALREVGRSEGGGWASTLDSGEAFWNAMLAGAPSRVVSTGLTALDRTLGGGLRDGELVVVGARPSLGKTAFVGGIAHAAGVAGHAVAFFTLEMPNLSIYSRLLSLESRIPLAAVKAAREGRAAEHVVGALGTASQALGHRPIYTQDKPATLDELRARASALRLQVGPLGLIVVDYLQLVREAPGQKSRTRENAVAEVSRELKMLAKELSCPLILLSQLNREVEKREDKRPRMSDLRETGSIEQDADIILFLHRDEYYERTEQNAGKAEVIVAKQRDGERDVRVPLRFDGPLARFHDAPEGEAIAQAPEPAVPPARMTYDEDFGHFGGAVGDAE